MKTLADTQLSRLADQYGTPLWVYDGQLIKKRVQQLAAFDTVRFAQKACSNLHILRLLRDAGAAVDAVSLGELERALHAGFSAQTAQGTAGVVFTADVFDRATLQRVVEAQVEVNVGSIDMLHQLGALSPGHRVWLRINPGFGHGHSPQDQHRRRKQQARHLAYAPAGCAEARPPLPVASGRPAYAHRLGGRLPTPSASLQHHAELVVEMDHDIEAISAGGGLSVPYRAGELPINTSHYFAQWDHARKRIEAHLGHPIRLEIEPGRFLVAQAGVLVSEVRATKHMGGKHFTLVDAGFNDLMRPSLYGSYHEMSLITSRDEPLPMQETVVAGPLCESGDVFTQAEGGIVESRLLPVAHVGDYLVFHDAGAYGASMSSNYNSRTHAAEVLVDDGQERLIRRRQPLDDLLRLEEDC